MSQAGLFLSLDKAFVGIIVILNFKLDMDFFAKIVILKIYLDVVFSFMLTDEKSLRKVYNSRAKDKDERKDRYLWQKMN